MICVVATKGPDWIAASTARLPERLWLLAGGHAKDRVDEPCVESVWATIVPIISSLAETGAGVE